MVSLDRPPASAGPAAGPRSAALYARARQVFPSGVTHDNRYSSSGPIYIDHAAGSRKWDVDGREYIDYWMGHGSLLLGHGYSAIVEAVTAQMQKGTHYGGSSAIEVRWGELVQRLVPSAERVKFTSSGTEADMLAVRLARAFTGRTKMLKFEGHFHGWSDIMTVAFQAPFDVPTSVGIPQAVIDTVVVAPANDLAALERALATDSDIACVIMEPTGATYGTIPLDDGFLQGVRDLTHRYGALLIFDEVVTGFRFAYGGAQEYYGVTPDLCTLGKIVGGGFALAAIAGRADIMAHFDKLAVADEDFLFQVGTLSGNPVASVAGLATLQVLKRPGTYERVFETGRTLMGALDDLLKKAGIKARVIGEPPLFDVVFTDQPVRDYRDTLKGDKAIAARFNQLLRARGIMKGESKYYVSLAHSQADIDHTIGAWADSIKELTKG